MSYKDPLEWLKISVYSLSYLYFIAAPALIFLIWKGRRALRIASVLALLPLTVLAYARFVEPRILLTAEHDIELERCFASAGSLRIALFSDLQLGIYGNEMPTDRIVRRVNAEHPDLVFIAGDFLYYLAPKEFSEAFAPLGEIEAPLYAVFGNHDVGRPGNDLSKELTEKLTTFGVNFIDDSKLKLTGDHYEIELVALSDLWAENQKLSLLEEETSEPRIVLTHNPATVDEFTPDMSADLLVGGHTHGGQIFLPYITCMHTRICGEDRYGLRKSHGVQVFTTSGTGMVGLPMRFGVPPRIDVLNVRYKKCPER